MRGQPQFLNLADLLFEELIKKPWLRVELLDVNANSPYFPTPISASFSGRYVSVT